jgi:hypothetical protein
LSDVDDGRRAKSSLRGVVFGATDSWKAAHPRPLRSTSYTSSAFSFSIGGNPRVVNEAISTACMTRSLGVGRRMSNVIPASAHPSICLRPRETRGSDLPWNRGPEGGFLSLRHRFHWTKRSLFPFLDGTE